MEAKRDTDRCPTAGGQEEDALEQQSSRQLYWKMGEDFFGHGLVNLWKS